MTKKKTPAFQFYPNDFLQGTATMNNAEVGAYIRLLCHQWDKHELPNDKKSLVRLCGGDKSGVDSAMKKFILNGNNSLINSRLEKTREDQIEFRKKQSEKGKLSADKRWKEGNHGYNPVTERLQNGYDSGGNRNVTLHSSSSSSNKKLSKQDAFECLRRATDKEKFTDQQIEREAEKIFDKYSGRKVTNLQGICNSWAEHLEPAVDVKKNKNFFV